jgi:hypothetical protein
VSEVLRCVFWLLSDFWEDGMGGLVRREVHVGDETVDGTARKCEREGVGRRNREKEFWGRKQWELASGLIKVTSL